MEVFYIFSCCILNIALGTSLIGFSRVILQNSNLNIYRYVQI